MKSGDFSSKKDNNLNGYKVYKCWRPAFGGWLGNRVSHGSTIFQDDNGNTTSISLGNHENETQNDYEECIRENLSRTDSKKLMEELSKEKDNYFKSPPGSSNLYKNTLGKSENVNYFRNYFWDKGTCNDHQNNTRKKIGLNEDTKVFKNFKSDDG